MMSDIQLTVWQQVVVGVVLIPLFVIALDWISLGSSVKKIAKELEKILMMSDLKKYMCLMCDRVPTTGETCYQCSDLLRERKLRRERNEEWPKKRTVRYRDGDEWKTKETEWCPHDDLEEGTCRKCGETFHTREGFKEYKPVYDISLSYIGEFVDRPTGNEWCDIPRELKDFLEKQDGLFSSVQDRLLPDRYIISISLKKL